MQLEEPPLHPGHAEVGAATALTAELRTDARSVFDGVPLAALGVTTARRGPPGRELVELALGRGINTFVGYPHRARGDHEQHLGRALSECFTAGIAARGACVIATRVGLLADTVASFGVHREWLRAELVTPGHLRWDELARGIHTLAPRCLRYSIDQSRRRLRVATLDGALLETPEIQLDQVQNAELDRRLRRAFEGLEAACADGALRWYGVARTTLAPSRLIAAARDVAGDQHRLRAIELTLSPRRADAALPAPSSAGAPRSLLDTLCDAGLYVFASGCVDGGVVEYELPYAERRRLGPVLTDRQLALQWVRALRAAGTILLAVSRSLHLEEAAEILKHPRPAQEDALDLV